MKALLKFRAGSDEQLEARLSELRRRAAELATVRTREDAHSNLVGRLASIRGRAHSRSCLSITFESGGSFSSEADDALVDTIVLSEPGLVDRLLAEDQPRPTREERDRELEQLRTEIADAEREQQRRTARARRAQLESELATLVEVEGD